MSIPFDCERLVWDDWNLDHIVKHAVTVSEVEEVVLRGQLVRETYKSRLQVIGPTATGRLLSVVVGAVPNEPAGVYYPFSARPASRKERTSLREQLGDATS